MEDPKFAIRFPRSFFPVFLSNWEWRTPSLLSDSLDRFSQEYVMAPKFSVNSWRQRQSGGLRLESQPVSRFMIHVLNTYRPTTDANLEVRYSAKQDNKTRCSKFNDIPLYCWPNSHFLTIKYLYISLLIVTLCPKFRENYSFLKVSWFLLLLRLLTAHQWRSWPFYKFGRKSFILVYTILWKCLH
jgi:hypothetical protein